MKKSTFLFRASATVGIGYSLHLNSKKTFNTVAASPTFEGIPVAATILIHQAYPHFAKAFPGLELSPAFSPGKEKGHFYEEKGGLFGIYPTSCKIGIPIFERLSQLEESRIGQALLMKPVVAYLILIGDCTVGCAAANLSEMVLLKVDEEKNPRFDSSVWEWKRSS